MTETCDVEELDETIKRSLVSVKRSYTQLLHALTDETDPKKVEKKIRLFWDAIYEARAFTDYLETDVINQSEEKETN